MLLLEWVLLLTVKAPSWNYKERRYAIFDFVTSENCQKSKIFFIAWYYTKWAGISFLSITNSLANSMPYLNEQYFIIILIRCGYIRLL
ncbi:hypothetical protein HanXRQr2_Chr04g0189141 [Helianthus annuus]|uniref:Uncharacterized protein n=1 Tax=Helianthus annuus TaxID=4232 RepID=A0A9K3JB60_HELAN|nr:hypothetical protein HanXRQr2_Chr04g0189141 [Helianthus annuus]